METIPPISAEQIADAQARRLDVLAIGRVEMRRQPVSADRERPRAAALVDIL
jgi:hypothetical protein